ncbi:MAG: methylated-DNA--[protein]-cysteine S-methyltransferase [Chloroflexi bacterium]|nr:methylated-DNA--[protein]-cysteine S-methyltransferase [Chloroflexota bacterium]
MNIEEQLRPLREVRAPSSLRHAVLRRVGIADAYFQLETPLGRLFVAYSSMGVSAVLYALNAEGFEREFRRITGRAAAPAGEAPARLRQTLSEWLAGDRRHKLAFDLRGRTAFERAVLMKALEIPFGEIRPYGWIAREIGQPGAVRAVGSALAHNPIPLFIPCHRVVRGDGLLGRYSLISDESKSRILAAEGLQVDSLQALAKAGVRYFGSDTTKIFCFPTCRHARRMMPRHRVQFGSERQARSAGYRPCKVCRPAAA